jgi:hypothetical protein
MEEQTPLEHQSSRTIEPELTSTEQQYTTLPSGKGGDTTANSDQAL